MTTNQSPTCPFCGHVDHEGRVCHQHPDDDACVCSYPNPGNFTVVHEGLEAAAHDLRDAAVDFFWVLADELGLIRLRNRLTDFLNKLERRGDGHQPDR